MIALLTGTIAEREEKSLIIDVHGVGYRVAVLKVLRDKSRAGQTVTLRIHHHVLEDAEALYGFLEQKDLEFFELLLTVPSVGPRTAMNILDIAPPPTLGRAVQESDTALLTKVAGIGRKTAERIIVELKGKLKADKKLITGLTGSMQQEVMAALVSVGYSVSQAREAVTNLPAAIQSVEEAVRAVLKERAR